MFSKVNHRYEYQKAFLHILSAYVLDVQLLSRWDYGYGTWKSESLRPIFSVGLAVLVRHNPSARSTNVRIALRTFTMCADNQNYVTKILAAFYLACMCKFYYRLCYFAVKRVQSFTVCHQNLRNMLKMNVHNRYGHNSFNSFIEEYQRTPLKTYPSIAV